MTPPHDEPTVAADLEAFLRDQFPVTATGLDRRTDLFDAGVIDSVGVTETLAHLEARYGIHIPDAVLLSEEFTTVDGMARAITKLCQAGST
jgi:acyl carrier protein